MRNPSVIRTDVIPDLTRLGDQAPPKRYAQARALRRSLGRESINIQY